VEIYNLYKIYKGRGQYFRKFFGKKIRKYRELSEIWGTPSVLGAYITGIILVKIGDFARVKFGNMGNIRKYWPPCNRGDTRPISKF
jgi:hypothetical protein